MPANPNSPEAGSEDTEILRTWLIAPGG